MRVIVTLLPLAALGSTLLAAQAPARSGSRALMARDVEIALARSAAPTVVSSKATVWILGEKGYVVAEKGASSVNCYVGRPWVGAIEPHCFDAEASTTIFPIQRFRVEQLGAGKSNDEVEKAVAGNIASGKFKLPARPAMTYMMSAGQELVTGGGDAVGAWEPHLMIYFPKLTAEGTGMAGFVAGVGFVENPDTPFSAFVIPVKSFVPNPAKAGS